jgi:hypothetical protein
MTKTIIDMPLVGIQHYKENYAAIMKKTRKSAKGIIKWEVVLVPEDDNPHDSNAVRVDVFGYTLGYIGRDYTQEARDFITKYPNYTYNSTSTEGNIIILSLAGA